MPLNKKSLVHCLSFISLAALLSTSSLKAEASQPEINDFSESNPTFQQESSRELPLTSLQPQKPLILESLVAAETPDSGGPALRREPSGGQRFEPKRIPLKIPFPKQPYRSSPSITIINPSAYGASWGNAGVGFGFQERVRFRDQSDGVIGLGFGLGNPRKNIGVQIGISLVDVSAPFRDGTLNLKLHRRLPEDFAVAVGSQGFATFGNTDGGSSGFGVVTKRFKLKQDRTKAFSELFTTLGVGGGQFRSESDINNGNNTIGIFGSVAVKIVQPVGLVAEWTGQDLTIGTPLVLFRKLPLVIVPAITDITGSAGDGTRLILGIGYTFSF